MNLVYGLTGLAAFIAVLLYVTDFEIKRLFLNHYFLIIFLGFAVRLLAARIDMGFQTDIDCFKSWASMLAADGFGSFYASEAFTDYPPGYMYVLYVLGVIRHILGLEGDAATLLIKLPAMAADIAAGLFIYHIAREHVKPGFALALAFLYIANPAVILDSSVWGQVDSVHTLVMLPSLYLVSKKRFHSGFALFALAVLIKPQALMFSPVYICLTARFLTDTRFDKASVGYLLRAAAFSLFVLAAGMLPFARGFNFMPVLSQYADTLGSYPYATINAYNFYAFLGLNWKSVGLDLLGIPLSVWGILFIVIITVVSIGLLWRDTSAHNIFFVAAFINITVFIFSVKMHERYVFPALALLIAAYACKREKRMLLLYTGFSATLFLNCLDILNVFKNNLDYSLITVSLPAISTVNMILTVFLIYTAVSPAKEAACETACDPRNAPPVTKKELLLLGGLIAMYSAVAFLNLGNTRSPQSFWRGDIRQEVIVDLGEHNGITRVDYLVGPRTDKSFELLFSENGEDWSTAGTLKAEGVFSWKAESIDIPSKYVKLVSVSHELYLMEMAFRSAGGDIVPVRVMSETGAELFDEQELVPDAPNYMNSSYFDEVYHPRTAYEFVHGLSVYETTHPPLGKVIIAAGVKLFGMTPFGWRFMGTLFGVFMIPLIYCFARSMFKSVYWAFFAALIFSFDFMHFAQTRLATIDTYVTVFVMAMFYFMYRYYTMSFYETKLSKTLLPLLLSGVFFGLAAASKWQGIYAASGLAVVFFYTLYLRYKEYRGAPQGGNALRGAFYKNTAISLAFCVVFFIVIPVIIYMLSYIPFLHTEGAQGIKTILNNQRDMFDYHAHLVSTHPYESKWWSWPFMIRPIFYYDNTLPNGLKQGISSFGNPAVWWMGIAAFFYCVSVLFKRKEGGSKTVIFLLIAFAAQYVPWILIPRTTYIYHYFPSVPFLVLMIAFMFKDYIYRRGKMYVTAYCAVVVLLFLVFYPVLSGFPVPNWYVTGFLKWLPSWALVR